MVYFQKDSPFLEDFNFLLDLKDQMGLEFSQNGIAKFIPNATKCLNWQDVKASHETDTTLLITLGQIQILTFLFGLGLGGAMVALLIECLAKRITLGFKKTTQIPNQR